MIARSLGARSYCKYAVKVTLTFATLQRNRGSRAQIHKNSMVFVNFLVQRAWAPPGLRDRRQAASEADQRVTEREPLRRNHCEDASVMEPLQGSDSCLDAQTAKA